MKNQSKKVAYKKLIINGKLEEIRKIRQRIIDFEINNIPSDKTKKHNYLLNDQIILFSNVQILCNNLLNNQKFIKSFINSERFRHKLWYPMPKEWIKICNRNEKLANITICKILWIIFCTKKISFLAINTILFFLKNVIYSPKKFRGTTHYLHGIHIYINNYEYFMSEKGKFNFLNWFEAQETLGKHIFIHSNPQCKDSEKVLFYSDFLVVKRFKDRIIILLATFKYLLYYLFNYNLKYSLTLNYKDLYHANYVTKNKIFTNWYFIFFEEMRLNMPIWVQHLSRMDNRVIFIEKSQAIEPNNLNGEQINDDFERLAIWPEVWTVTDERINYLLKFSHNKNTIFRNVGLPWLGDTVEKIPTFRGATIAVFDIEPHRGYYGISTYNIYGLQEVEYAIMFLQDIVECAEALGIRVLHKPKREIKGKRFPEYQAILNKLSKYNAKYFLSLEPGTAINYIAQQSLGVIATPFTSAVYAGSNNNIKRVYYDPLSTGISTSINIDIDIIHGKTNLMKWLIDNCEVL